MTVFSGVTAVAILILNSCCLSAKCQGKLIAEMTFCVQPDRTNLKFILKNSCKSND